MTRPTLSFTAKYNGRANVLISSVSISPAFDPATTNPFPPHKEYQGIWDTGATNTVITRKIIDELTLKPIGMVLVKHARGEEMSEVFLVNIRLPNNVGFSQMRVTEGTLSGANLLVGMDIINKGDFAITHKDGKTTFSFRIPSTDHIDFVEQSKLPYHSNKISRNAPCPCGSGKKYKKCCGKDAT